MRFQQTTTPSRLVLATLATVLLAACTEKKASDTDVASAVRVAAQDTMARPALRDAALPIDVVRPESLPTIAPAPIAAPVVSTNPAPGPTASRQTPAPRAPRTAAPTPTQTPTPTSSAPSTTRAAAPTAAAPAAAPAPEGIIASGTSIRVTSGAKVCTGSIQVGDRVVATTASAVSGTNGVTIPAGARVSLVVTKAKKIGRAHV